MRFSITQRKCFFTYNTFVFPTDRIERMKTQHTPRRPACRSGPSLSIKTFHNLLTCRNGMQLGTVSACHSFFTPILKPLPREHTQSLPVRLTNISCIQAVSSSQQLIIFVTSAGHVKRYEDVTGHSPAPSRRDRMGRMDTVEGKDSGVKLSFSFHVMLERRY